MASYIANEWSMTKLLTVFFGSCGLYLVAIFVALRSFNPRLGRRDMSLVIWFVLSMLDGSAPWVDTRADRAHSRHHPFLL